MPETRMNLPASLTGQLMDLPFTRAELMITEPLDFSIETQTQSNWCWAAVAASVGHYYQTGNWSQCGIASNALNFSCCDNPWQCNVYGYLDIALTITHSFNSKTFSRIEEPVISNEIQTGRPVCLRCAWNGGGAHFVVIYGVNSGHILVADSIYGYSVNQLENFPAAYQSGGQWTHTYLTQNNTEGRA